MKKAGVKEAVGQELVKMTMDNVMWPERERAENRIGQAYLTNGNKYQPKNVNAGVDRNQRLDRPRKRRE
ncbi:MAG TPA: hypothetical protein VGQ12_18640 [Candidatus Angelobacter sp.]|nr:hypothetical protein [Candidatus Angelobacter sp.]